MDFCNEPYHPQACRNEEGQYADTRSRILQQRSGNVGIDCESTAPIVEEHGQVESKQKVSLVQSRSTNSGSNGTRLSDRKKRKSRHFPWQKDPNFIRYEFQSERYCTYRTKSKQNGAAAKWPDDVEDCFQYALRILPVLGRKKDKRVYDDGGQGGRNELIQDYIKEWTGEHRGRKQVSSHIQVLKSYMRDNPAWMRLVTTDGKNDISEPELKHRLPDPDFSTSPLHEAKSISKYASMGQQPCSNVLPPPMDILGSNVPYIRLVNFEMSVKNCNGKRIHTYTEIQSEKESSAQALEEVSAWRIAYPDLASYYDNGQVDCELVFLETKLGLTKEYPPRGASLEINPFIVVVGGRQYYNWQSSTYLYERGRLVHDERKNIRLDDRRVRLEAKPIGSTSHVRLTLNIQSKWWAANVFPEILYKNYIQSAQAQEKGDTVPQAEEWGRHFLGEMSMMQEVYASSEAEGSGLRRIAILLWKFKQTEKDEAAVTTWRKLVVPNAPLDIQSPGRSSSLPMQLARSMDTSLQDKEGDSAHSAYTTCSHEPSFFVDDAEGIISRQSVEEDSSFSTSTADLRSLPSSTATSFASSMSESLHPTQYTQEPLSPFQGTARFIHDVGHQSHHLVYTSQDSTYYSQVMVDEASDMEYMPQESPYPGPSQVDYQQYSQNNHTVYPQPGQFDCPDSTHALSRDNSALGYTEYPYLEHSKEHDVQETLPRRRSYEPHSGNYPRADAAALAGTASDDFRGGHIHISFDEETGHRLYDQDRFGPPGGVMSRYESFNGSNYDEPLEQVHQSNHPASQTCSAEDFHDQHHLAIHGSQHHEQMYPIDSLLHHPVRNELELHHPQPQASLQHHIDSARWQTHNLWTQIDLDRQNKSEDSEEPDETLTTDAAQKLASEQIPGNEGSRERLEQEQGRIIGEVSKRLEQELEKEMAREAKMEV